MLGLRMPRVSLIGDGTRTLVGKLVDALAVAILCIEAQPVIELPPEPQIERIIVCIYVARRYIDREERVAWLLQEVLIHQSRQLVRVAPLIADGSNQLPRQSALDLERVDVDVRVS